MSYQQPWGTDRPPLNPPKNPSNNGSLVSAGDTSFKTNVNRNKTQRWVQAPSYSYDGDDWGEADEYNEYGPQEAHQSPSPLSTGPRRDSQAIQSPASGPKGYGALTDQNPTSGGTQVRNTTQPMMARPNSFDKGDDKRVYSAGVDAHPGTTQHQAPPINTSWLPPSAHISETRTVDTPKALTPVQSDAKIRASGTPTQFNDGSQEASKTAEPTPQPSTKNSAERTSFPTRDASLIGPSHKSPPKESSPVEARNARGVSASAIAQTSQTRSPAGAADSPGGGRFPPRKSSLSQDVPPYDVSQSVVQVQNHPSQGSEDRARSSSNPSKPLQIIRPSDIYKRVNEERERERQSLESVRPSMEAITGTQSAQIDHVTKEQDVREESSRRTLSPLEPVQERKSEYGFDGFTAERPQPLQTSSNKAMPGRQAESEPLSAKPKLPDVPRLSGFGDDFFNLGSSVTTKMNDPIDKGHEGFSTFSNSQNTPLQHQHSKGFRSVVEQAFDKTVDDKSVPPTPSSGYHSQVESIKRTDSESTSGISPIMSRFSSTATAATKARDAELHRTTTPAIAEEISDVPELHTSGKTSSTNPQSAEIVARKPSPAPAPQNTSSDSLPQAFKPGHRRDLSTPSPNNSPARSPELETNKPLAAGQDPKVAKVITVEDGQSNSGSQAISPNESEARDTAGSLSATHGGLGISSSYIKDSPSITRGPVDNLARPGTERLESFRPLLPGGWVSYATTPEGANTPNLSESEKERATRDLEQQNAAPGTFLKDGSVKPNSLNATPTISDSQLAGLEAAHSDQPITPLPENPYSNTGVDPRLYSNTTSTARAIADDQPERNVPEVSPERNQPRNPSVTGAKAVIPPGVLMPLTDLEDSRKSSGADAKIGRDLPKSGQPSSSENGDSLSARPLQVQKTISSSSSIPPTPPPKDTPLALSGAFNPAEYFPRAPNPATSQQQSSRAPQPTRIKPQLLPALSTETSPNDQESDRLRKEIVRSLSPQSSSAKDSFSAALDDNKPDRTKSDASQIIGQSRESTFLPSEYESYWATTSETSEAIPAQSQTMQAREAEAGPTEATLFRPDLVSELQLGEAGHANAEDPLLPDKTAHQPRPGAIKNRFSWETETDLSPSTPADVYNQPAMPTMPIHVTSKEQANHSKPLPPHLNPSNTAAVSRSSLPNSQDRAPVASSPQGQEGGLFHLAKQQPIGEGLEHIGDVEGDKELAGDRAVPVEGRSVSEIKSYHELSGESGEKEFTDLTETSLQPTGGVSSEPSEFNGAKPFTSGSSITSSANASLPFVKGSQNMAVDVPSFRQILAMKSPSDRILTYNSSRAHFANEPSGLSHWMAQVVSQTPEHRTLFTKSADVREGNWNLPGASTGVMPSGSGAHLGDIPSAQPMAQPYYQQYVQAANSPTSPPGSGPPKQHPVGHPSGSQGFSPSGNKLSTQQVQAKGKDLLHTAGVFGGKANHAAKGLFAKGRSKFRGSGGGDKGFPSLQPSPLGPSRAQSIQATGSETAPMSHEPVAFPTIGKGSASQYNHSAPIHHSTSQRQDSAQFYDQQRLRNQDPSHSPHVKQIGSPPVLQMSSLDNRHRQSLPHGSDSPSSLAPGLPRARFSDQYSTEYMPSKPIEFGSQYHPAGRSQPQAQEGVESLEKLDSAPSHKVSSIASTQPYQLSRGSTPSIGNDLTVPTPTNGPGEDLGRGIKAERNDGKKQGVHRSANPGKLAKVDQIPETISDVSSKPRVSPIEESFGQKPPSSISASKPQLPLLAQGMSQHGKGFSNDVTRGLRSSNGEQTGGYNTEFEAAKDGHGTVPVNEDKDTHFRANQRKDNSPSSKRSLINTESTGPQPIEPPTSKFTVPANVIKPEISAVLGDASLVGTVTEGTREHLGRPENAAVSDGDLLDDEDSRLHGTDYEKSLSLQTQPLQLELDREAPGAPLRPLSFVPASPSSDGQPPQDYLPQQAPLQPSQSPQDLVSNQQKSSGSSFDQHVPPTAVPVQRTDRPEWHTLPRGPSLNSPPTLHHGLAGEGAPHSDMLQKQLPMHPISPRDRTEQTRSPVIPEGYTHGQQSEEQYGYYSPQIAQVTRPISQTPTLMPGHATNLGNRYNGPLPAPHGMASAAHSQKQEYTPTNKPLPQQGVTSPERTRRGSGIFKGFGSKPSKVGDPPSTRSTGLHSHQTTTQPERPHSVASSGNTEPQRKNTNLFSRLTGQAANEQKPPGSRESLVAHPSRSRTDLLADPPLSPQRRQTTLSSPQNQHAFTAGLQKLSKAKPPHARQSARYSTSKPPSNVSGSSGGKKNRFSSGFDKIFGSSRNSVQASSLPPEPVQKPPLTEHAPHTQLSRVTTALDATPSSLPKPTDRGARPKKKGSRDSVSQSARHQGATSVGHDRAGRPSAVLGQYESPPIPAPYQRVQGEFETLANRSVSVGHTPAFEQQTTQDTASTYPDHDERVAGKSGHSSSFQHGYLTGYPPQSRSAQREISTLDPSQASRTASTRIPNSDLIRSSTKEIPLGSHRQTVDPDIRVRSSQQSPWTLSIPDESVEESNQKYRFQEVHPFSEGYSIGTNSRDQPLLQPVRSEQLRSEQLQMTDSSQSPTSQPLPESTVTSPINPEASQVPPPPPPKIPMTRVDDKEAALRDQRPELSKKDDSDEEIVMTSTAFPGQEWAPAGYLNWDGEGD